jgi:hypothetical protein
MKNNISTKESQKVIIFLGVFDSITSFARKNNALDVSKVKGTSLNTVEFCAFKGYIIADTHKIKSIFAIFDQTIFHRASHVSHFIAEIVFINISGAEVQIATIVNQITKLEIQNFFAKFVDQFTRYQAHFISIKNQTIISM